MEDNKKVKLSAPWFTYYREIDAMFSKDPDVRVEFNEESKIIKMYVNGQEKAEAIAQILPPVKEFGNVAVEVQVIPANKLESSKSDLFRIAFEGNPILVDVVDVPDQILPVSYVVFKKEVVQFFDDNLSDIYGNKTTLYQEIAKDIFVDTQRIFFCTEELSNCDDWLGCAI